MNDLDILAGGAMGLTGFFLVMQASMLGSGNLGWITRPWYSRAAMIFVALLFWVRAWTVFHGQPINPVGRTVCFALLLWQFVDLLHVITASWRGQAARALRLARRERNKASKVLTMAISLLEIPPYTKFKRLGDEPPSKAK